MLKNFFTRKNLILIAIFFLYSVIFLVTGIAIDEAHAILPKSNFIYKLAKGINMAGIELGTTGLISIILDAVYIFICPTLILYIRRVAKVNKIDKKNPKLIMAYIGTVAASLLLSVGLGLLIQSFSGTAKNYFGYLGHTLLVSLLLFIPLFGVVCAILMIAFNLILIDKPFKFFSKNEEVVVDTDGEKDVNVKENFDGTDEEGENSSGVAANFGEGGLAAGGVGVGGAGGSATAVKDAIVLDDREKVFPGLYSIDQQYDGFEVEKMDSDEYSLEEISTKFRNYLASEEHLYYDIQTIRFFISSMSTSHFAILEGLSGTGKSSLPRYFAKFITSEFLMTPVQTTWRDRTSLLGYFNDFNHTYTETEFLLQLYKASYNPDQIFIFVLDEMNISRIEYYFADFLSVLEGPKDTWRLKLMQLPFGFVPPALLDDGYIKIPANVYFVGTANRDDSTFTITDKVYDRAITIDFTNRNDEFIPEVAEKQIAISASKLQSLFDEALANPDNLLTDNDFAKFLTITDRIYEDFDVPFGNRILNQMKTLVPVYVACGGTKEEAFDFLLTRKVLSKLEGRFEDYVKTALKNLLELIAQVYGANVFVRSEEAINRLIRRL